MAVDTQKVVPGTPQSTSEVNIMDYMGSQASAPFLQPETQITPTVQPLQVQPEEIQQVPVMAPAPVITGGGAGPTAIVGAPVVGPTQTAQLQEAAVVEQPALTETEAASSYQQVSEEADAFQAAKLELSTVDPRATVQGQLALLQEQFAEGETPVWAQGAMKQATALMAQRGIGASTMAAEAITNALMQSALPIAQQDASFYQEVSLTNLSNSQQTEMAKFNARLSSIFNDQAAENTARNINAASANELSQFYSNLSQNVVLTNTAAYNAMEQFNSSALNQANQFLAELNLTADQINVEAINERQEFNAEQMLNIAQFNASMQNNREQFQVQNQMAIDASNVSWRRDVNLANTSALNAARQADAQNLLALQQTSLNNIWDHYDTILNFAFNAEENQLDRATNIAIATMDAEMRSRIADKEADSGLIESIFNAGARFISTESGQNLIDKWI